RSPARWGARNGGGSSSAAGAGRLLGSCQSRTALSPQGPGAAVSFDYEAKSWGAAAVRPKPWYMNGLKLRYLLDDLSNIHGRVLDVGCGGGSVAKAVKRERPDLEVFG